MLHLIVTGRTLELGRWRATTFSVVLHAGLILAAVTARSSLPVRSPSSVASAPVERIRYVISERPPASSSKPTVIKAKRKTAPLVAPIGKLPALALTIPSVDLDTAAAMRDEDLTGKVTDSSDFKTTTLADVIGAALIKHGATAAPTGGVYRPEAVDRIISPYADNPKPIYPRSLESMGVEADFTVMFVVDSTGRVDEGTLEIPKSVHRLFADAVRYALLRSRYFPAQLAGHSVRQLVAQEFVFRMKR
jgi:protein TonB